jgi:hypothetical protein
MSALFQVTDFAHVGVSGEEVTEDQVGSPERLLLRQNSLDEENKRVLPNRCNIPTSCYCCFTYS